MLGEVNSPELIELYLHEEQILVGYLLGGIEDEFLGEHSTELVLVFGKDLLTAELVEENKEVVD